MRVWRLGRAAHREAELTGEGARRYGGRWNSRGHACVYAAASLELALLETLVHLDLDLLPADLLAVELELPEATVAPTPGDLPADWDAPPPYSNATQDLGDAWLEAQTSLAIALPSSVLPQRRNVLINPAHPDIGQVTVVESVALRWPRRLLTYLESLRRR